ncbi:MAG TPA: hypothetical protein VFS54_08915 [Solirubrobacterales bacterium]|nr:hypothetical protein [Solirubrobacterales bacterium]
MYAVISIDHEPGNAIGCLQAATGMPHSPSAIVDSSFPGHLELAASGAVLYSAANASWVVFSSVSLHTQLQLVVSSKHGNVKQACEDIWRSFRSAGGVLSPRLSRMEIIDPASTAPIATGETGIGGLLKRMDFNLALWPGVLTLIVIGAGMAAGFLGDGSSGDIWLAGSPAILVSLVALFLLIRRALGGEITWLG